MSQLLSKRVLNEQIRRCELEQPTRARSVCAVLKFAEEVRKPPANRRERRSTKRVKEQGHPSRVTSDQRRRRYFNQPADEREARVRELNRMMRQELQKAREEDGEIVGPLRVVARFATPHLLRDFGLDYEAHQFPFEHWLMVKLGDVLRRPDVDGYLAWREAALRKYCDEER